MADKKTTSVKAQRAAKKPAPVEETPPDPRIVWPTAPKSGRCASAVSWHTWESKCGRFQVARITARQGTRSGFSCQFRETPPDRDGNGASNWELIAYTKQGPTYTRLFRTLRECMEAVDKFAQEKLGYGSFNLEQMLSEADKQGMGDVPSTQNIETKSSRRVAEEDSITEVPPYVREENAVKISKKSAVELLTAVGLPSANLRQPVKVLAKNLKSLPLLEGIKDLQLDDDGLQKLLTELLVDLAADKGVEVAEDAPAKGGKGKPKGEGKPSKNGSGNGFGTHTGQRYELFGYPVTAVIRWMGKNKFDFAAARKALDANGVACADATVKIQLRAGAKGERGDPAKLSKEDQAKLAKAGK